MLLTKLLRYASWILCPLLVAMLPSCQTGSLADDENDEAACVGPLGAPVPASQLASMSACCAAGEQGEAHCLADTRVPDALKQQLATCDTGGYCVPDAFLLSGGAEPPATCTAFGGQGVCLSRCIPEVAKNAGLLKPDTCTGADELCVPCISPLDNMPTGACDLLEQARCVGEGGGDGSGTVTACDDPNTCTYESGCPPVVDTATLVACGDDAHCAPAALITDPAQQAQLAKCADGTSLCVPDFFLETGGKFIAKTCVSVAGAEGRCLSRALPDIKDREALLPQDSCAASERCAPCFDPITGVDTGACKLSCDPGPTKAPVKLAACCEARAHCVPAASVPDEQEQFLGSDTCESQDLCVPDQILLEQPIPTCTAQGFFIGQYEGVCLSDCLEFGFVGVALARGTCANGYTCTPCEFAGQPTGAPGC